jgi:hypothetical protein
MATEPNSLWMAEIEFRSSHARAFGETPEAAVKALTESWREYCRKIDRGDPNLISECREDVNIERCDSGRGYIIGVVDAFWHDVSIDSSDKRFDALFKIEADPAPSM